MEEFENESDKGVYWIIFFVILLVLAIVGYHFAFNTNNRKDADASDDGIVNQQVDVEDYKGVWTLYGDEDTVFEELCINVIDGSTITFDYFLDDGFYFESQTAHLKDNVATFEIKEKEKNVTITGKMTFRNDKIYLVILSSSDEEISPGTIEFTERADESVLN